MGIYLIIQLSVCSVFYSFLPSFLPSVFDVVFVSLCPPVSLSIFSSICLSLYPSACLSTKLCAYVPFLNSFFFSLVQSIFLSGCLSVCLLVSQSICPCNPFCLSGSLKSICLSINMFLTVSFNCPHMVQLCCLNELFEFLSL